MSDPNQSTRPFEEISEGMTVEQMQAEMDRRLPVPVAKPWLKQPGEVHDKNGVPIYPGDLIRSFHFRGARRKVYYLYHVAVYRDGALHMVPASHLEPTKVSGGGQCLLSQDLMADAEVISGHGPGEILDFGDRKKVKRG